jgi:hypothetical protein
MVSTRVAETYAPPGMGKSPTKAGRATEAMRGPRDSKAFTVLLEALQLLKSSAKYIAEMREVTTVSRFSLKASNHTAGRPEPKVRIENKVREASMVKYGGSSINTPTTTTTKATMKAYRGSIQSTVLFLT